MAKHRDEMTDEEMAVEIGVPVALVAWARAKDPDLPPPDLDPAFDVGLQQGIINNQNRLYSVYGLLDDTRPN